MKWSKMARRKHINVSNVTSNVEPIVEYESITTHRYSSGQISPNSLSDRASNFSASSFYMHLQSLRRKISVKKQYVQGKKDALRILKRILDFNSCLILFLSI